MKTTNRGSFSGKLGYILAVAGSAVGLGNIWRFPYLTAKYGGGIFLLVYIILAVTFGYTLIIAETAIGRKTGKSAIAAFSDLSKKHTWMGYLNGIIPMLIAPYYCVIGGWVLKYFFIFLKGGAATAATDSYFSDYISQLNAPIFWTIVFIACSFLFVVIGIKGIEKASTWMMPILAVLSVIIAIYSVTRPGAMEGLKYYLIPDFGNFSLMTVVAALGQMFYSLSIAMGVLFAYGSYMNKKIDMEASVKQIELFDIGIAFTAGLMVIPAVFSFSGGDSSALNAGPGLMFVTLPKVFHSMSFGNVIGALFFVLVFFAALTSAISLVEASIAVFMDRFHLGRKTSCAIMFLITLCIGIPCSLGFGLWGDVTILGFSILDFFDFITNSVLMPIAALCTCYFVSRVIGIKTVIDEVKISSAFKREKLFTVTIQYIAPLCILVILVCYTLSALGVFSI